MNIDIQIYRPIECESIHEAIGRAYALSKNKGSESIMFCVSKAVDYFVVNTVNEEMVRSQRPYFVDEEVLCGYNRGVKTVWP